MSFWFRRECFALNTIPMGVRDAEACVRVCVCQCACAWLHVRACNCVHTFKCIRVCMCILVCVGVCGFMNMYGMCRGWVFNADGELHRDSGGPSPPEGVHQAVVLQKDQPFLFEPRHKVYCKGFGTVSARPRSKEAEVGLD